MSICIQRMLLVNCVSANHEELLCTVDLPYCIFVLYIHFVLMISNAMLHSEAGFHCNVYKTVIQHYNLVFSIKH